jgi:hypothetical protein
MNDIESALYHVLVFKRIDDSWFGLLVLGIFMSLVIAIVELCLLWRRDQQRT